MVEIRKCLKGMFISFFLTAAVVTAAMAAAGIFPGGPYAALLNDSYDQMAAMQAMLARHIMEKESIFYSTETSLGQNTALLYAFCSYSPSTLLFMLIPDAYTAMAVGIILKLALSSAMFYAFISRLQRKDGWLYVFFSLCYGLCGYQFEYMLSTNLLDALYLLPLVMLCLLRALRQKRFTALTIAYTAAFVIQFYSGFLIGLFSAAAFMGILYLRDGRRFIQINIRLLMRYALSAVTAALMSMCLLFPAILFFLSSTGFNSVMVRGIIAPWDLLYGLYFGRPTSLVTDIPFIYCGTATLLLLPLYFLNKDISKRERALMGASVISLALTIYLDPLYYFLHAFNRPDGFSVRYAFLYVFLLVTLAVRAAGKIKLPEKPARVLFYSGIHLAAAVALILIHEYFGEAADGKGVVFGLWGNIILFILWGATAVIIGCLDKKRAGAVLAFVILLGELTAQAYFNCREQGRVEYTEHKTLDRAEKSFAMDINKDAGNRGSYRGFFYDRINDNANALYGYQGIGQFASSNYTELYKLLSKLGDAVNGIQYTQTGATDATDMIFGIRYRGSMSRGGTEVYERALPVGFMASAAIAADQGFDGNVFENQNRLLSSLCGCRIDAYRRAEAFGYEENNAVYEKTESGYSLRRNGEGDYGDLLIGIPAEGADHAYAYFSLTEGGGEAKEFRLPEDMALGTAMFSPDDRKGSGARYECPLGNSVIEMSEDGELSLLRLAVFDGEDKAFRYAEHYFCYQIEEELDRAYGILAPGGWRVKDAGEGFVRADVTAGEEKPLLFMSIPYDKGWNATVDGKRAEILPVAEKAFMALYLTPGEHEIELSYEAPGADEGRLLALAGLVLMLVEVIWDRRKRKDPSTSQASPATLGPNYSCDE